MADERRGWGWDGVGWNAKNCNSRAWDDWRKAQVLASQGVQQRENKAAKIVVSTRDTERGTSSAAGGLIHAGRLIHPSPPAEWREGW